MSDDTKPTKLIVPGHEIESRPEPADTTAEEEFGIKITTEHSVEVSAPDRGIAERFESPDLADDVVVELEYEDDSREWTTVGELRQQLQRTDRAVVEDDAIYVPSAIPLQAGVRRQRGVVDLALKGLKLLNIDPVEPLVDETVEAAINHIEGKLKPGLYSFTDSGEKAGDEPLKTLPESSGPTLVLLHGTFSTTEGSFAALLKQDAKPTNPPTEQWEALYKFYEGRVYGFDHRTLGDSPIENACQLLELLPKRARIHLVSHSRGGLIGELLAHGPLSDTDIRIFTRRNRSGEEIETLHKFTDLMREKEPAIERFVRVASPGRGTALASNRLDRYLSILLNLIGKIPAVETTIVYPFARTAILTLVKKRADPTSLPGLEALMPQSPLVRLLNDPDATTTADLAVISGDIQGEGVLGRLGVLATDLFYWEDHDLVVNTRSMYQGVRREKDAYYTFHKGPEVQHFHYFLNPNSRTQTYNWLTHKDADAVPIGFEKLTEQKLKELDSGFLRGERTENADAVFVIPGMMGSHLAHDNTRIWLNLSALAGGDLSSLDLTRNGAGDQIQPDDLIAANYQELLTFLGNRFEVVTFPYDWRKSALEEGNRLAVELNAALRRLDEGRAVHLLAHSQGGLVARAMIAQNGPTWKQICDRGGRLVMLGTPNLGTYVALQLLTGQAPATQMLQMLDPAGDADAIARIMRTFPGLAEMLPDVVEGNIWEVAWWDKRTTIAFEERSAFAKLLRDARRARDTLAGAVDAEHMRYVAGTAAETLTGVRLDGDQLVYQATAAGDGIVPHRLGPLEDVSTWYADAAHGDLANHRPAFAGIADLLENGTTNMLSTSSSTRGLGIVAYDVFDREPMLFPTENELAAEATGSSIPMPEIEETMTLRLSVAHGSLEHAETPVAVGYYYGDVMDGAARFLDSRLDDRLTTRLRVDLFSGLDGTAEVVLAPGSHPPGGLVIGLGEVGQITAAKLSKGVTVAALRYALQVSEDAASSDGGTGWRSAGFSSVLVGTQGGRALSIEDCISAIVKGALAANWALRDRGLWDQVRIDKIEFVELYENIATHAAHIIADLPESLRAHRDAGDRLEPLEYMRTIEGGLPGSPAPEYNTGWWRRLQIGALEDEEENILTKDQKTDTRDAGGLRFVMLTDRARAKETLQATQQKLVDQFIEQTIHESGYSPDLAATLYELLFPNTLKEQSQETGNVVLLLDNASSRYPWEMLAERRQGETPTPLACSIGMLRQLKTTDYRARVQPPRGNNALVVGDPNISDAAGLPRLPGAAAEARIVRAELKKRNYNVSSLIGDEATALAIMNALFEKEYRVLHIAGHGVYDADRPERSGVVIGNDIYLTAAEIEQLRVVPEVVFLNCCHLAKTDQERRPSDGSVPEVRQAWNRLAASISEQLIKIGVRAVIAAGWAVDDDAAQAFAQEFYKQMLGGSGRQLGEAVRMARERVYDEFKHTNTWGAYQCYGDPGFVLGAYVISSGAVRPKPVAEQEVIDTLKRISKRAGGANAAQKKTELEKLAQIHQTLRDEWRTGRMLYQLGVCYGELGEFGEAIRCYESALARESIDVERSGDVPFRAVDQLANLQARYAATLERNPDLASHVEQDPKTLLQDAVRNLEWILSVAETPHRLALLGSAYKRIALLGAGDERTNALNRAEECYGEAHRKQLTESGDVNPYYVLNWLTFRFLLGELKEKKELNEALELLEKSRDAGKARHAREPNFWDRIAVPDSALLAALIRGTLNESVDDVQRQYLQQFNIGASARERASVLEQIEFLTAILEDHGQDEQVPALETLHNGLAE